MIYRKSFGGIADPAGDTAGDIAAKFGESVALSDVAWSKSRVTHCGMAVNSGRVARVGIFAVAGEYRRETRTRRTCLVEI